MKEIVSFVVIFFVKLGVYMNDSVEMNLESLGSRNYLLLSVVQTKFLNLPTDISQN